MHLDTVPTVERSHDGLHTRLQCGNKASGMDVPQLVFTHASIAAVDTSISAAVTEKVLGGGHHLLSAQHRIPLSLQPFDHRLGIALYNRWIFGIALVGSAPTIVSHHSDGGSKGPVDTRYRNFLSRGCTDTTNQVFIASRPQTNVVRK